MGVTLAGTVLFFHIGVAIAAFMIAGVLHTSLQVMPRAATVQELRAWGKVVHRLEPLFPVLALVLLGLGAWLVHLEGDEGIGWSSGWVITAVTTLVIIEALGGILLAPRGKALVAAIEAAGDGPVPDDVRARTVDPVLWHLAHLSTGGFLGVVFIMAAKPSGAGSVIVVVVAAALGVAASVVQLRAMTVAGSGSVPMQRGRSETAATESV